MTSITLISILVIIAAIMTVIHDVWWRGRPQTVSQRWLDDHTYRSGQSGYTP